MYTKDFRQYSAKIKVPWWILYHHLDDLKSAYEDKLGGYLTKKFRVTTRAFNQALKCRITVIFDDIPSNPEAINNLIERVAKEIVPLLIIKIKRKG